MDRRDISKMATLVNLDDAKKANAEDQGLCLVVLGGSGVGNMFPLTEASIAIGRDDAGIQILDAGVSRQHAQISYRPDGHYVEDLGSRNGTLLNGEVIDQARRLTVGDKLQIGLNTVMRVSRGDELETKFARHMYEAALRDGLTGAYNRRYLDERLVAEVAFSVRHETPLALLLFDIDHFKRVNDAHGHPCGDSVLKQLAKRVGQTIRAEDVLARYGGEEFVVICRDTDAAHAAILAERIRTSVEGHAFTGQPDELAVTVSIGVADLARSPRSDGPALIETADKALYRAKQDGRNRVVLARSTGEHPTPIR